MPACLIRKATGEHFSVSNSLEKSGKFSNASFWSAFSAPPKNSALAIFVFDAYRTSSISQTEPKLSYERCSSFSANLEDGIEFQKFSIIRRGLKNSNADSLGEIERIRRYLLMGADKHSLAAAELRKNWYFLESAVRCEVRNSEARRDSLAFRVFAKYRKLSRSCKPSEEMLARSKRLIFDGENDTCGERVVY
jgi:hypothetical protein